MNSPPLSRFLPVKTSFAVMPRAVSASIFLFSQLLFWIPRRAPIVPA